MSVKIKIYLLAIIVVIVALLSLILGTVTINPFADVLTENQLIILWQLRVPRLIAAIIAGATLAASGVIIQLLLKNDLADSSILGFQSGSVFAAMLIILVFPHAFALIPIFAFIGGIIVFMLVILINRYRPGSMYMVLIGIAINAIMGSLISLLSITFSDRLENTLSYTSGSIAAITQSEMMAIFGYGVIGIIISLLLVKRMEVFELEDFQIQNLAINVNRTRFIFALISVYLSAISVAFIGIIGFVGLVAPHICRMFITRELKPLLISSMLMGSLLVSGSDLLQRVIIPYYEIPVGTIMSLIGGIFFLGLIMRRQNA